MIFHFRKMDAGDGWMVALVTDFGIEITVMMDDGYCEFREYEWDVAVAYEGIV